MAAVQEIRANRTTSTFLQVRLNIQLEKDKFWKFEEDLNVLRIEKDDFLLAAQVAGKHIDVRDKSADEINQIISDALKEKNIVFRIVKKDHPDAEKILNIKSRVSLHSFGYFKHSLQITNYREIIVEIILKLS